MEIQIRQIRSDTLLVAARKGSHVTASSLFRAMRHIQGLEKKGDRSLNGGGNL